MKHPADSDVPCNGCTLCCQGSQGIPILEGENAADYETQEIGSMLALAHKPNGDCVYLDRAKGCTIYERRPIVCRGFDCAGAYKRAGHAQARAQMVARGVTTAAVLQRGHQLLRGGYRPKAEANRRRMQFLTREARKQIKENKP